MKKLYLTLFSLLALLFISMSPASAAEVYSNGDFPKVKNLVEEISNVQSLDALHTISNIESLSESDLNKLEDILNDPEKLIEELNKPENQRTENINLDISDKNTQILSKNKLISPLATTYTATGTVEKVMSLVGIDLVKYELVGKWTINSTKTTILSADSMTGYATRVWLPGLSTVFLNSSKSATSSKFNGAVTFSYDLGVGNLGVARLGVVRTGFSASPTSVTSSYLYTE